MSSLLVWPGQARPDQTRDPTRDGIGSKEEEDGEETGSRNGMTAVPGISWAKIEGEVKCAGASRCLAGLCTAARTRAHRSWGIVGKRRSLVREAARHEVGTGSDWTRSDESATEAR